MDSMETTKRRELKTGDVSDAESENLEEEEDQGEEVVEDHLLRVVVKLGTKGKMEVPMYKGRLNVEELLEWIRALEKVL